MRSTLTRTILSALLGVVTMSAWRQPRRQPTAPMLQIKGQRLVGDSLKIESHAGKSIELSRTGSVVISDKAVTINNAAVRSETLDEQRTQLMKRAGESVISAHEAHERERQQMISRSRKHRTRKRKQKRGY